MDLSNKQQLCSEINLFVNLIWVHGIALPLVNFSFPEILSHIENVLMLWESKVQQTKIPWSLHSIAIEKTQALIQGLKHWSAKRKRTPLLLEILRFKANTEGTLQLKTLYLISLVRTHLFFKQTMCWGNKEFIVEYLLQVKRWVGLIYLIYPH